jgi:Right handed beta helix region
MGFLVSLSSPRYMSRLSIVVFALVAIVATSCEPGNPFFCEGRAHSSCLNEAGTYPCRSGTDCLGQSDALVCDADIRQEEFGVCVQCTALNSGECQGMTPVCGSDNSCRGCNRDSECESKVCNSATGACTAETTILYVAPAGRGTDCTRADPCDTFSEAIGKVSAARDIILVAPGSYSERVTIANANLTISAMGAELSAQTPGQLIDITGSSIVSIRGLRIHSGLGVNGDGIRSSDQGGNSPSLTLRQVTIEANGGKGISASGGALTVTQSTVSGNQGGGISAMNATFDITNNFVVGNGNPLVNGSDVGGVSLQGPPGQNRFEFNTVAFNAAKQGTLLAAGIACSVTNLVAPGNIVTSNNEGLTFPTQTKGVCSYGNSFTDPGSEVNTLKFKSITTNPPDFHLTIESPASVVDAGGACTGVDVDGDARPQGVACDLGADEYKAN